MSNDHRRLEWAAPRLAELGSAPVAHGACETGTGASGECFNGQGAYAPYAICGAGTGVGQACYLGGGDVDCAGGGGPSGDCVGGAEPF